MEASCGGDQRNSSLAAPLGAVLLFMFQKVACGAGLCSQPIDLGLRRLRIANITETAERLEVETVRCCHMLP